MVKSKRGGMWWFVMGLGFSVFLTGAHGPCSTACPSGSYQDREKGCWIDLDDRHWRKINQGELMVKLDREAKAAPIAQTYRFVFIRDPHETYQGKDKGRFGDWRLQITRHRRSRIQDPLLLRWQLRDDPGALEQHTVRLVATWMQGSKRTYKMLQGQYDPKSHQVHALLPSQLHSQPALWVFPARARQSLQRTAHLQPHQLIRTSW